MAAPVHAAPASRRTGPRGGPLARRRWPRSRRSSGGGSPRAPLDHDAAGPASGAEPEVQQRPRREDGDRGRAPAVDRPEVVDVRRQRRRQHHALAAGGAHADAVCGGDGDVRVEVALDFGGRHSSGGGEGEAIAPEAPLPAQSDALQARHFQRCAWMASPAGRGHQTESVDDGDSTLGAGSGEPWVAWSVVRGSSR